MDVIKKHKILLTCRIWQKVQRHAIAVIAIAILFMVWPSQSMLRPVIITITALFVLFVIAEAFSLWMLGIDGEITRQALQQIRDIELVDFEMERYDQAMKSLPQETGSQRRQKKYRETEYRGFCLRKNFQFMETGAFLSWLDEFYAYDTEKRYAYWVYRAKAAYMAGDREDAKHAAEQCRSMMEELNYAEKYSLRSEYGPALRGICAEMGIDPGETAMQGRNRNDPENLLWDGLYDYSKGSADKAINMWRQLIRIGGSCKDAQYARVLSGEHEPVKDERPTAEKLIRSTVIRTLIEVTVSGICLWLAFRHL